MIFGPSYAFGTTLNMATYFLSRDQMILSNLRRELDLVWPESQKDCPSWVILEQVPYLVSSLPPVCGEKTLPELIVRLECYS